REPIQLGHDQVSTDPAGMGQGLEQLGAFAVAAALVFGEHPGDGASLVPGDLIDPAVLRLDAQLLVVGAGPAVSHDLVGLGLGHGGGSAWFTWLEGPDSIIGDPW